MQMKKVTQEWLCRGRRIRVYPPVVMAIVNVTPDSFFAPSRAEAVEAAVARGLEAFAAGARIVDVGGESTRPGAEPVSPEVEAARTVPVIAALRAACPEGFLSIDTRHPEVAEAAVAAGADIVNQVEGCTAPLAMAPLLRRTGAGYILMHSRGTPETMDSLTGYDDVVAEVAAALVEAAALAEAHGVAREQIALDPGLGFAKTAEESRTLLEGTDRLAALPYPCVIGASRKRFLGGASPEERLEASLEAAARAAALGAGVLRVHDVAGTVARLAACAGEIGVRDNV